MENYKKYKAAFPNKTDAECIESLCYEVKSKVEEIHRLLAEIMDLKKLTPIRKVCTIGGPCDQRDENNECKGTVYCGYRKYL